MTDLMAVDREINHYIVGNNIEEIFEQKSNKSNIHRILDNAHHGQGVHSVKTSSISTRFLGLSITGWVTSKISHLHAFKHLGMYGRASSTTN